MPGESDVAGAALQPMSDIVRYSSATEGRVEPGPYEED